MALIVAAASASATPTATPTVTLIPAFDRGASPTGTASYGTGKAVPGSANPAAAWLCTVYASDPWKTGGGINGEGSQFCSGVGFTPVRVYTALQQYRGLGVWASKAARDTGFNYAAFLVNDIRWNCAAGTGTQTYRVVTSGYAEAGRYGQTVVSQNYLRVSCP